MGNFLLGVLVPLPCDDLYEYVAQTMKTYEGEGNKTDGWEILAFQSSERVDATPYAYIAPGGSWHERVEAYPEEEIHSEQIHLIVMEHLAQYGYSNVELMRQRVGEVPEAVTDWYRTWRRITQEQNSIVAFVWCHC